MATLAEAIADNKPLIVPSIYDGISALLVRDLRFEAAYIGNYATGATRYGVPDINYIGLEDAADQARRLARSWAYRSSSTARAAGGNPARRPAVQVLRRAGAAATHIEDHDFGKHLEAQQVISTEKAVDKIKAAVDARSLRTSDHRPHRLPVRRRPRSRRSRTRVPGGWRRRPLHRGTARRRLLVAAEGSARVPIYADFPQHSAAGHAAGC
jgi:hypothetical protein